MDMARKRFGNKISGDLRLQTISGYETDSGDNVESPVTVTGKTYASFTHNTGEVVTIRYMQMQSHEKVHRHFSLNAVLTVYCCLVYSWS